MSISISKSTYQTSFINKTVLVTGGAGFIGSSFAKKARQQGWEVTVLDNLSTGHNSIVDELELSLIHI